MSDKQELNQEKKHKSFIRKWGPLVVMSLALAIIIIDTTVLNVSISSIIKDLGTDLQTIQWAITLYSLVLSALTITGGRLGDLFGRKRMFMLGAFLFAIGSLTASFAWNSMVLLIGWSVIEGIGAALMLPATTSLLVTTYHGKDRGIAFAVWGALAGASAALGPILGGYLTQYASWHWAFRINVFVVTALLIGAVIFLKESYDNKEDRSLDFIGVILSSIGFASLVYGIVQASEYGWFFAKKTFESITFPFDLSVTPIAILIGIIFITGFLLWEKHMENQKKTPLVSVEIFKNKTFTAGLVLTAILALGQAGLTFSIPVFYQAVKGYGALDTGIGLLPLSLTILVAAPLAGFLSRKIAPKLIVQTGVIVGLISPIVLALTIKTDANAWTLAPGLALYGFGMGLVMSQISNYTLSAVDVNQAGEASGLNSTIRQLGATLGSAIIGAIFLTFLTSGITTRVDNSTVIPDQLKSTVSDKINEESSNIEFSGTGSVSGNLPQTVANEIQSIVFESIVDGNKVALLTMAGFSLLTLGVSFLLPREPNNSGGSSKEEAVVAGH